MAKPRPTKRANPRLTFDQRVELLCRIVQIANAVVKAARGVPKADKQSHLQFGAEVQSLARNSTMRRASSINQLQSDFLTAWNEGVGPHVEEFWRRIKASSIPIERRDVVRDVLERKRIKNRQEYETIVDSLVILQQIGKITAKEAAALDGMLDAFEKRQAR